MNVHSKQRQISVEDLKRYGAVLGAVLSIFTALTPLFGKSGLVKVLPLPITLSTVGPPLATLISVVLFLSIILARGKEKPSIRPKSGAVASFILALITLAIYLSRVREGAGFPAIWLFSSDVVTLLVYISVVVLWTCVFAFMAVNFFESQRVDTSSKSVLTATPPSLPDEQTAERSRKRLFYLVYKAEWETVAELAQTGSRLGFWGLYGAIAKVITGSNTLREQRQALGRASFWYRAVAIWVKITPRLVSRVGVVETELFEIAGSLLEGITHRLDISERFAKPNLTKAEMYKLCMQRFNAIPIMPWRYYGLDRWYFDYHDTFCQAQTLFRSFDNQTAQSFISSKVFIDLKIDFEKSTERFKVLLEKREKSIQEKSNELRLEVLSRFVGGALEEISPKAFEFGREMFKEYKAYPEGTIPKFVALYYAVDALCVTAAAIDEVTPKTFPIFLQAMSYLVPEAIEAGQGLAACNLALEMQNKVTPIVPELPNEQEVRSILEEFLALAELARGAPCGDVQVVN